MIIFPVLDLMDGQVVRGVAGRRDKYRPIESVLTKSSEPRAVAEAIDRSLGVSTYYVADLDAIRFGRPQLPILRQLARSFPGLWLDAGIHTVEDVSDLLGFDGLVFVAGLETIAGPDAVRELCQRAAAERAAFSLDLKNGKPLGQLAAWRTEDPLEIAEKAIQSGIRKLIVLDLAQVGMGEGVSTLPLCEEIKRRFPDVFLVTGGGIRSVDDLLQLKKANIDGVLVASAIHSGAIGNEELSRLAG